ncbi:MAG: YbaB/EbfC family nucleoid-associated protein [Halobacteriovoraceae bacterium]|jgi:nucleoid-associated protein EbfC|nr:YbaB/EbfC family nucleoid-associated protein [Halobacteriovoraceae bacterium]
MANINQLMKQAGQMQTKMKALQKELDVKEFEVSSGGGMVTATVNGKQELIDIKINKECVDPNDVDMLEDLVKTAVSQALKESSETVSTAMSKVTGGLNMPGLF